ncbi:hypothetical protein EYF80_021307 [Liparis tanakae]|uniref:Uncharacterized protein n=1 Tax=Liparis tanakae TaxID=230148 RepID=A0A4Z2HUF1_9TELE|nr:hypothetical protein EYF80_021307 [Liparis tanakae]
MMTSQADTELSMLANTKYKRCCFRKGLQEGNTLVHTQGRGNTKRWVTEQKPNTEEEEQAVEDSE